MKKLVMTVAVLACAAMVASAATVTSANIVGYYKVDKPESQYNIASIQMKDGDLNSLLDKSQFVGYWLDFAADSVILFDAGSQAYQNYALYDGNELGDPTVEWRDPADFFSPAPAIPVKAGTGFWVVSQSGSVQTKGLVVGEAVTKQSATNSIVMGYNLISFPFSCTIDLNSTSLAASGATGYWLDFAADSIIAFDAVSQSYKNYALYDGNEIGDPTVEWRDPADFFSPAGPISLDLGKGFWYSAQNGFTWVETNPYYGNL